MSTQQSAQERAEKYVAQYFSDTGCVDALECAEDFLAGEISGHQRAMDEMSAKITDLEAQNKKLGDVVLEMAKAFKLIANNCVDKVTAEDSAWVLERSADLIKQLKQERGE